MKRTGMSMQSILSVCVMAATVALMAGCGGESGDSADSSGPERGSVEWKAEQTRLIQASIDEAIERFKHNDLAGMYDMEFPYMQERYTYDEYLKLPEVQGFRADSLDRIVVRGTTFSGDTATVDVEIVFNGSDGREWLDGDVYKMYLVRGRWIKPLMTATDAAIEEQRLFEQAVRAADSAAEAEAQEGF